MIVSPAFAGRRYGVLGLARSGLATVRALLASGAEVVAWDSNEAAVDALAAEFASEGARLMLADFTAWDDLRRMTAIVVSPGVPLNRHPLKPRADAQGVPVIGDIELFSQARPDLPAHRIVGITGTNGKSTTTALIHHILESAGYDARLGGNIGLPILGQEPLAAGGIYVLELSSYQIDLSFSLDCDVAVLLNITPDHLDRYDAGFAGYAAAKARLFTMQDVAHEAVIVVDDDVTRLIAVNERTRRDGSGHLSLVRGADAAGQQAWPALQGPHNAQNAAAAIEACRALDVPEAAIAAGLATYPGLPHRMERVAQIDGVLYVNDSKATNATSVAPALAAYKGIHWILGGVAKTAELDACEPHFDHVRAAYTIGDAGAMFARLLAGKVPVDECHTLDAAIEAAAEAARPGEVVMLSPACASFDQYRDYEHRGAAFRVAVARLMDAPREAPAP
ncbi:UDP-N-acetylmuramoyl-L-alanine--D-glutamate ligase [Sphingomonas naphthae]|uniref:UDP-N-acetylmuramoylalanine--D-glutamate ligase n=1 Tax=Sphingomonas naphthae TaxID=1813468 RepID=A0ABY7TLZ3_9SPHN|nr:UDP-N-acetylmuramoyl-L-alanine--D-glutamate ligase [Sphingomonas naphthae]WCT74018.1 UDP-N-acetylmuramoyl-L-alanine--D-glutamate ligase [Sphingomonas naphthae]